MRKPKSVNSSVFSPAVRRELERNGVVKTDDEGIRALCLGAIRGQVVTRKTDDLKLSDEQKTRLLSFALKPIERTDELEKDEERGDLLCDILRCSLPVTQHLSGARKDVPQGFLSIFGSSLGELLCDPKTDIAVLRQVKEYAKDCGRTAGSDVEKEVFLALYSAAIAAAWISHGTKITEHADCDLLQFFTTYASAAWIPEDLLRLFCDAAKGCQKRSQANKKPPK